MKKFLLLLVIVFSMTPLRGSPYMGGEITWECLPNGNFRFIVNLYRECAGNFYPNKINLISNSPEGNTYLYLYPNPLDGREDLSPVCNPDTSLPHIVCPGTPWGSVNYNTGALEKWTYTSDSTYPNGVALNGVPPVSGWYFAIARCCRNPSTNISNPTSSSYFLRAIMYPYQGTNTYPCFDHSPRFLEDPPTAICTGYPYNFNHGIFDPDNDALTYEWGQALNNNVNNPVTNYNYGYSYDSPFPDVIHNPNNLPAQIDPHTGNISLHSYTPGAFLNVIKVTAFRSGEKIAEVFREFQVALLPCGNNAPPEIDLYGKSAITPYLFVDTAYPGDTIHTNIFAFDTLPEYLPNGQLASIELSADGAQFGHNYTSDTGCSIPPCATLGASPPIVSSYALNADLNWTITNDHYFTPLFNNITEPYYDFHFKVQDDFCPIPGVRNFIYRVFVRQNAIQTSDWHCQRMLPQGGIELKWNQPTDPDTLFRMYKVYHKFASIYPWSLMDSITQVQDTMYIHSPPTLPGLSMSYKVELAFEFEGILYETKLFESMTPRLIIPGTACQGDVLELSTQEIDLQQDSLVWDFGNFTHSSGSGTGPHWLIADSSGLQGISLEMHNACGISHFYEEVLVHPLPDIHIIGPRYYCPGTPLVLTAIGGQGFQWSTMENTPSITLNSIQPPVSFHVTVTDQNYCTDTASVNIRSIIPYPDAEICMVSVDPASGYSQVLWDNPDGKDIDHYRLLVRNANPPQQWTLLGNIPYHQAGYVTDSLHDPSQAQYHYAIQVVDSCDDEGEISAAAGAMRLQAYSTGNADIILSWTPYEGMAPGHYVHLYRYVPSMGSFVLVDSVVSSLITYTDQNAPLEVLQYYAAVKGMHCFDPAGNIWTEALSNTVSVDNTTGLDAPSPEDALRIFTVPSQPYIFIERAGPRLKAADIHLFDVLGRQVMDIRLDAGVQKKLVPSSGLVNGVYYYLVRHSGGTQQGGKLVVGRE